MSELQDLQQAELQILKDIDALCERHKIEYSLAYGSLLGAIRHKGFIPWDDDIDILIHAGDVERFAKAVSQELGNKYFAQTPKTEPYSGRIYTIVRKNGTLMLTKGMDATEKMHQGVGIDVFPVTAVSENKKTKDRQIKVLSTFQNTRYHHIWNCDEGNLIKRFAKTITEQIIRLYENILWVRIKNWENRKKYTNSCIIGVQFSNWFSEDVRKEEKEIIPKVALWGALKKYPFEDAFFFGPEDYDTVLKKLYGSDYMIPKKFNSHVEDFSKVVL